MKPGTQKVVTSTAPEPRRSTPQPAPLASPVSVPTNGGPALVSFTVFTSTSTKHVTTLMAPRPIIPPNLRPYSGDSAASWTAVRAAQALGVIINTITSPSTNVFISPSL